MIELAGKSALVTGGARRVGAEVARALGAAGMRVAVHYHSSAEDAERVCAEIDPRGERARGFRADLGDRVQARQLVAEARAWLGGIDLLVLSAANFDHVRFEDIEDTHWDRALALNVTAPFVVAHAARDDLRASGGAVVLITCISRRAPYREFLPYEVSKAATHQLMRLLALELAPDVRVNAVAPGTVLPPDDWDEARIAALAERIPLGRVGTAQGIAAAVLHLARSDFMTGEELVVDGGRSLR